MQEANAVAEVELTEDIKQRVEQVWAMVFRISGKILKDAKVYGFEGLGELPAPNIHDMVLFLKLYGAVIETLYVASTEYDQQRQLLNSKKQIATMEEVAAALIAGRNDDYERAINALEKQCVV